ncbi:hypothetical protein C0995_007966 [Termitomyces sp. Mi166|nr:hypothetical protein C0995_007966 [Termitomyces sp. Mi166\
MSESVPPPQQDPAVNADAKNPTTKSAAKKEAKRLEKEAKLAAKAAKAAPNAEKKAKAEKAKKDDAADVPFVNTTPKGEKKDMTQPMAAGYNPIAIEAAWYDWWSAQGFFKPESTEKYFPLKEEEKRELFVVPAPPPNVTGSLHIGHGLTTAIQDSLVRWNRMLGRETLFAPGFDHAGISTQSVVEKRLYKTSGKTRHDLGREKFVDTVREWKDEYQAKITNQLHRLGGSYDWDRVAFTMNETLSKAVIETFCKLHEEGVIYRANRLVNWCVKLNTTLSNLEVEQKQLTGRTLLNVPGYDIKEKFEFGVITSFAYVIEGSDERIIVATTRPETMLGDTAIAVHPDDPRYKHLHGKFALHPFLDRRIPIVTDSIIVDMEFGTGAVKITPAHDPNDYEVGMRHNLEFINILNDDGTFNANAGEHFNGMKRFHARVEVVKLLKEKGLYIETKDNPMQIPICSKSGDLIEPVLKPQWWVNCKPLAEEAMKVNDGKNWVVGRTMEEALQRGEVLAAGRKFTLEQDEDVLDTWFSSGLWPFSIMGWPDNTSDFQRFYPASLLETGWDILFFWVARMVLLGIKLTGQMPFKEVYCHAMIRDAHGRKMSKSLGNVIDPIDVIQGQTLENLHAKLREGNLDEKEVIKATAGQKKDFPKGIPQCGTDALRFALCAYSGGESLVEKWILHKLNIAAAEINTQLAERNFMNATTSAYNFWLYELCDVYIEAMKPMTDESVPIETRKSAQQTLYICLDYGLRLLHPFMPFVTEELWQRLPRRPNDSTPSIMVSAFPVHVRNVYSKLLPRNSEYLISQDNAFVFEDADKSFDLVFLALKTGRSLAASYNLQTDIQLFFHIQNDKEASLFGSQIPTIVALTKGCKSAKVVRDLSEIPAGCGGAVVTPSIAVHTLVRGLVDLDVEIAKCDKKLDLARLNFQKVVKVESQADYAETVPENVRLANEEKRKTLEAEIATLELSKEMFTKLK